MSEKDEHPFPNDAFKLLLKIHQESLLDKKDQEILSDVLNQYLCLRAEVFYDDDK